MHLTWGRPQSCKDFSLGTKKERGSWQIMSTQVICCVGQESPCLQIFGTFFFTHAFLPSLILCCSCTLLCNYIKQTTGHCLKTINLIKTTTLIFLGSTSDKKSILKRHETKQWEGIRKNFGMISRHAFQSYYFSNAKRALNLSQKYPLLMFSWTQLQIFTTSCTEDQETGWQSHQDKLAKARICPVSRK